MVIVPASPLQINSSVVDGTTEPFEFAGGNTAITWVNTQNNRNITGDPFSGFPVAGNGSQISLKYSVDPWFYMIFHGEGATFDDMVDAGKLGNLSQTMFTKLWSDLAQQFLRPTSVSLGVDGSVSTIKEQIVARHISVRIAQTALALMVLTTVGVVLLRPRTNLPRDPSSLAAIACLLRSSEGEIWNAMHGTGAMSGEAMASKLEHWNFATIRKGRNFLVTAERAPESKVCLLIFLWSHVGVGPNHFHRIECEDLNRYSGVPSFCTHTPKSPSFL
jgi:hypothetical protein